MAELCREFGIARKTGYKILDRYKGVGFRGSSTSLSGGELCPEH
jgi:hypothetical protein